MAAMAYTFGIEIESVMRPYTPVRNQQMVDWYRQLARKLENRDLPATYDDCSRYSKHPEFYGEKWFVTRDGTLQPGPHEVSMEVVSPKLTTTDGLIEIIQDFWEAMRVLGDVQPSSSCGGHVHVTPLNQDAQFTLSELKRIAFAVAAYEEYVTAILPPTRQTNQYCQLNSKDSQCRLNLLLQEKGRNRAGLQSVADELTSLTSARQLCDFMQGSRYVLWNFANIHSTDGKHSGTVEFRGGAQFRASTGTLAWVAFVLGFITLALSENIIDKVGTWKPKTDASMAAWWIRIRGAARKSNLKRFLPVDHRMMQGQDVKPAKPVGSGQLSR